MMDLDETESIECENDEFIISSELAKKLQQVLFLFISLYFFHISSLCTRIIYNFFFVLGFSQREIGTGTATI